MSRQRGVALITALGVIVICLAVALILTSLATGNSRTVGNAYQKQQYYNVAESGIDRGLRDIDSSLPSPGASGFINATPTPPAAPTPGTTQTPLPNVPNVSYSYSYWYNAGAAATPTADPIGQLGTFGVPSTATVNVPSHGAVIWSYTTTGLRDVAVEAIVDRFSSGTSTCALCSGTGITVFGSNKQNGTPPSQCGGSTNPDKVCTDPSPNPTPTFVPIITGGTYTVQGTCFNQNTTCAYGDGSTPTAPNIQQNASAGTVASFLSTQSTVDPLADAAAWKAIANNTSIKYVECSGGTCSLNSVSNKLPTAAGQITYVNGSISLSGNQSLGPYSGLIIVQCFSMAGNSTYTGSGTSAETIAWGTDAQCGGSAITTAANSVWNGGTAYAANGSVALNSTGSTKYNGFYGAVIAATTIAIGGNATFTWESGLRQVGLTFGPYTVGSFAQY